MDGTGGTESENTDEGVNERVRTGGTGGTPVDNTSGKNEGVNEATRAQVGADIEPKEGVNESDTHSLGPSHASYALKMVKKAKSKKPVKAAKKK